MHIIETNKKESQFIAAYLEAVDFTELGEEGQPPIGAEIDEEFLRESIIDCLAFYSRIVCYLSPDNIEQAGHDFWLTRNGHGAGFWDKPEVYGETYAEKFTKIAESFGEAYAVFDELPEQVK
jgi:hypothetical protein